MKIEIITNSVSETESAGSALAKTLAPSSVVTMFGEMGAGKTAFVRGLAAGLGFSGRVTSPTFTIVNEYEAELPIFHFDMSRLSSASELFDIGWEDYLHRGGVCLVEWGENVADAFNGTEIIVTIEKLSENGRKITVEVPSV